MKVRTMCRHTAVSHTKGRAQQSNGLIRWTLLAWLLLHTPVQCWAQPFGWGRNNLGQLGNGTNTNSNVPVAASTSGALAGKTITAIAAGESHSLALASDGRVYAWGANVGGQLGTGITTYYNTLPVAVSTSGALAGKTITAIAAGAYHSMALTSEGRV
jgi:alpha-tubulin suppressor-like RCC1 family protein